MSNSCIHINAQNITFNTQNKKIYKDECMRCYDDQVIIEKNVYIFCNFNKIFID
jgi:uncharacterized UBP type Zn finger protein